MEGRLKIHRDPFRLRCWLRVTVNCHLCPERYRVFSHRGNGCPGVSLTLNKLELAFDVQSYSPTQVALRRLTRAEADCWQGGRELLTSRFLFLLRATLTSNSMEIREHQDEPGMRNLRVGE